MSTHAQILTAIIAVGSLCYAAGAAYTAGRLVRHFCPPLFASEQWGVFFGALFWPVLVAWRILWPVGNAVWFTVMRPLTALYDRGLRDAKPELPKARALEEHRKRKAEEAERELNSGGW